MGRTSNSRQRLIDAGHELIWATSYGSVTIDAICQRARVKKGTFYHFFDSKADLVIATIDAWWDERRPFVRACFSPEVPPLERILRYVDAVAQRHLAAYAANGRILGCPMFTLASEICTVDEKIRAHIQAILDLGPLHFGEAIREAQARGQVYGNNPQLKGRLMWSFYEGTLIRARVENNPRILQTLCSDLIELAGVPVPLPPIPHYAQIPDRSLITTASQ